MKISLLPFGKTPPLFYKSKLFFPLFQNPNFQVPPYFKEGAETMVQYVNFDADIPASEPLIIEHKIDWRQKSREDCINAVLNENNIAQEISDDDNDDDEEVDEIEDKTLSFTESLKMLDKINKCSFLDEESHKMLSTATKKLENLQLQNKAKVNNMFQLISIN